jgi:translin
VDELYTITEALRAEMNLKTEVRDRAVTRSRELIRHCSEAIRAVHRREWDNAETKLALIRQLADELTDGLSGHPELYHAGYTQDALKEVVEAHTLAAMIRQQPLPDAAALKVSAATYLNGLAEAATELRRFILDIMRQEVQHSAEAERLLDCMDAIYDQLVTFDFPDAITSGLRRQTDVVRGVLEKTRGDLTTSFRQQMLQEALQKIETATK